MLPSGTIKVCGLKPIIAMAILMSMVKKCLNPKEISSPLFKPYNNTELIQHD